MPEHLNGKQRAANRTNDRVNGVPSRVDPRNFVREKFEEIQDSRDGNNHGIAEHFERLVGRSERDPVEMNGQPAGENCQVKINAGEASEAERDAEKVELFHDEIMRQRRSSASFWASAIDSDTSRALMLDSASCSIFV